MKKFFKVFIITLLCIILLVVLFAGSLITAVAIQGYNQENACFTEQIQRVSDLESAYEAKTPAKVDESSFCDFDFSGIESLKYNQLRTLGSHNSYKKQYSKSAEFATKIFFPFAGENPNQSDYYHESFTDQLTSGLRSFELDIAKQSKKGADDKLVVQHVPLLDGNSWTIDLALGLKEIGLWSAYNPNHMPITILLEIKTDFLLKPGVSKMTNDDLTLLEKIASDNLGKSLFTPSEMLGEYSSFKNMRLANGFPSLSQMQGKVMILLHPGILTEAQLGKKASDTKIFAVSSDVDRDDASADSDDDALFLLDNVPSNNVRMSVNVSRGFIVRTRIDQYLDHDETRYANAVASNAQILSSDYIPRVNPIADQYVCLLHNGKTMTLLK